MHQPPSLFPNNGDEVILGLYKDLIFAQRKDPNLTDIRMRVEGKIMPRKNQDLSKYKVEKDLLWVKVATDPVERWAIMVPPPLIPRNTTILSLFHERQALSHLGRVFQKLIICLHPVLSGIG